MARKISKTKQKQKQKQSQKVIVNITQPKRVYRKSKLTKDEPKPTVSSTKPFIPLMPSFNINQPSPSPSTDLAKILGMLIPKLQTESTLGNAIPVLKKEPVPKGKKDDGIAGLTNLYESIDSLLPEALNAKVEESKPKRSYEKPRFENPFYDQETESEAIPLVEAEVKPKRKYIKSGKYSKKNKPEVEEE